MINERSCFGELYLHRTLIDQHSVELNESIVGAAGFAEDNSCNTTAYTVGSIGKHGSLHMAHRFAEVFL